MKAEKELKKRAKATIRDYFSSQRFNLLMSPKDGKMGLDSLKKLFDRFEEELKGEIDKIEVKRLGEVKESED